MEKKKSIWARLYISFWHLMRKVGVWDFCPNCDSAWMGGHPNPETIKSCLVCGEDKKEGTPNDWVWGWVVPMWIQRRIVGRRIEGYQQRQKKIERVMQAAAEWAQSQRPKIIKCESGGYMFQFPRPNPHYQGAPLQYPRPRYT